MRYDGEAGGEVPMEREKNYERGRKAYVKGVKGEVIELKKG